jgi:hypothetical protein
MAWSGYVGVVGLFRHGRVESIRSLCPVYTSVSGHQVVSLRAPSAHGCIGSYMVGYPGWSVVLKWSGYADVVVGLSGCPDMVRLS